MIYKKIIALLSFMVLLIVLCTSASAAETAQIYSDTVYSKQNSIVFVPVRIKNNPGIMGFKITVKYDKDILSMPTISNGSLTQKGMINDNTDLDDNGSFDVVWTNTENVNDDGELFNLSFNSAEKISADKTDITLTYSQADTFNEKYEDVALDCRVITVSFDEDAKPSTTAAKPQAKTPSESDYINAVEKALVSLGISSINDIDENIEPQFLKTVNENISGMTGYTGSYFSDTSKVKESYTQAVNTVFINSALASVDHDDINAAVSGALKELGVSDISQLKDDQKEEFVSLTEKALQQKAPDLKGISGILTADEAVGAIGKLQEQNEENLASGRKIASEPEKEQQTQKNNIIIIVIIAASVITVIVSALIIYRKKHQKSIEEDSENE